MAKRTKQTIWTVKTGDLNYSGNGSTFLLEGQTAAEVEAKALKLAKQYDLLPGEKPNKPYIRSIELVGELDG
jgi:hypothetical protein